MWQARVTLVGGSKFALSLAADDTGPAVPIVTTTSLVMAIFQVGFCRHA
jgi:hypothetical protein